MMRANKYVLFLNRKLNYMYVKPHAHRKINYPEENVALNYIVRLHTSRVRDGIYTIVGSIVCRVL